MHIDDIISDKGRGVKVEVVRRSNRQCHEILFYDLFFISIGLCLEKLSRLGVKALSVLDREIRGSVGDIAGGI